MILISTLCFGLSSIISQLIVTEKRIESNLNPDFLHTSIFYNILCVLASNENKTYCYMSAICKRRKMPNAKEHDGEHQRSKSWILISIGMILGMLKFEGNRTSRYQ